MSNFYLANYQSFTIDKSLIKKVFSSSKQQEPLQLVRHTSAVTHTTDDVFDFDEESEAKKKQRNLRKTIG